jgi:outer membrane receptor protein involved in Fe transport
VGARLRESAEAVHVVETQEAKTRTEDMGQVLAREHGVSIRRTGGLGAGSRFNLAGLEGEQVRFYVDGVPLELAGFGQGLANVPVNLFDRVEIYKGVVPIRLGADALGGAVNLATDERDRQSAAAVSYQAGSFGLHRIAGSGRYHHAARGVVAGANAYHDRADNDYRVDVEVPDTSGRLQPATVPRFHDAYRASGGAAEIGLVDRSWAKRLSLRGFATTYDKELQHNVVMTVPYGEARHGETSYGATLRYEQPLGGGFSVGATAHAARRTIEFVDEGAQVYDWFGNRIRERIRRGEIGNEPLDQIVWQDAALARLHASYEPNARHALRLSAAPTFVTRDGEERLGVAPGGRDPLAADRTLRTLVTGIEYQTRLFAARLENVVFAKHYLMDSRSEEVLPAGVVRRLDQFHQRFGAGDALRMRLTDWLYAKASYEFATRLPAPDEIFGDGVLIQPKLDLAPERSHNANVGLFAQARGTAIGNVRGELESFLRESDRLIVLLGNDRSFQYQNVYAARATGVEGAFDWSSPADRLGLGGNATWQDVRNVSDEGTFGDFEGDRIPNRPWLFANAHARVRRRLPRADGHEVTLGWNTRYVHWFYRGWESQGLREFKQRVDAQLVHGAWLTYALRGPPSLSLTVEAQNVTDAKAFDHFGVQRPGRAFFMKLTGEL